MWVTERVISRTRRRNDGCLFLTSGPRVLAYAEASLGHADVAGGCIHLDESRNARVPSYSVA
jgi:hypothetical protein